jgi:hypothetical protein
VFEAYLAFYVHKVFENSARLNDVFIFWSDFSRRKDLDLSWQNEECCLASKVTRRLLYHAGPATRSLRGGREC